MSGIHIEYKTEGQKLCIMKLNGQLMKKENGFHLAVSSASIEAWKERQKRALQGRESGGTIKSFDERKDSERCKKRVILVIA